MRKVLLFSALMCCAVAVSAQNTEGQETLKHMQSKINQVEKWNRYVNTFNEALDSLYGDFQKSVFEYDERFNCVKIDHYWFEDSWVLDFTEEYGYDEQNRIIMRMETSDGYAMKSEFIYDGEWITEEYESALDGGVWYVVNKYTYEYDSDGRMVLSEGFAFEEDWVPESKMTWEYEDGLLLNDIYYYHGDNSWNPLTRNDYFYTAEGLCQEQLQSHWEDAWTENWKIEYEYDEVGNRHTETTSTHQGFDDWIYTYMTEYYYDDNGNCYATADYYYDDLREWALESTMTYHYDLSVLVETTAGIWMVWDDELPIHNKLLDWQLRVNDDDYTTTFYYSECVGLNEKIVTALQVWPNPASETVRIDGVEVDEVQVYNALGQVVKTMRGTNEITVAELPQGVYLLRIADAEGKVLTAKLAVNK